MHGLKETLKKSFSLNNRELQEVFKNKLDELIEGIERIHYLGMPNARSQQSVILKHMNYWEKQVML